MNDLPYEHFRADWQGILIEVRYCPSWSGAYADIYGYPLTHLIVESIEPARAVLPITETGYVSHFVPGPDLDLAGGPLEFILGQMDEAANHPSWKQRGDASRQYALF